MSLPKFCQLCKILWNQRLVRYLRVRKRALASILIVSEKLRPPARCLHFQSPASTEDSFFPLGIVVRRRVAAGFYADLAVSMSCTIDGTLWWCAMFTDSTQCDSSLSFDNNNKVVTHPSIHSPFIKLFVVVTVSVQEGGGGRSKEGGIVWSIS